MARAVVLIADLLFGSRVQESLRAAGHEVELVGGRDALQGRLEGCDVLVVDLVDPELGGVEAVQELAGSGRAATCPRSVSIRTLMHRRVSAHCRRASTSWCRAHGWRVRGASSLAV